MNSFVLEELRPYFSLLFEHLTRHELGHTTDDPTTMELIVSDFNENITDRVKTINSSLLQDFSDHRTAVFVVNVIFSQLLTAYQQFLDFHDQLIGKDRLDDGSTIPIPMSISEVEQRLCRFHPTSREGRAEGRKVIG